MQPPIIIRLGLVIPDTSITYYSQSAVEVLGTDVPLILTLATPVAANLLTDKVLKDRSVQPFVNLTPDRLQFHLSVALIVHDEHGIQFTVPETFLLAMALEERPSHDQSYNYFCFLGEVTFGNEAKQHLLDEFERSGKFFITLGADADVGAGRKSAILNSSSHCVECLTYSELPVSQAVELVMSHLRPSS